MDFCIAVVALSKLVWQLDSISHLDGFFASGICSVNNTNPLMLHIIQPPTHPVNQILL